MAIRTNSPQQMGFDLPEPVRLWTTPESYTAPTSLPELTGLVALDFETKDLGITKGTGSSWCFKGEGFICGASFWGEDIGQRGYAPIAHAAGNMDPMLFWTWLRKQASKPDVTFVMANSIYDAGWLARHDITPTNSPYDVQAMAFLLNEHRRSNSLSSLAKEYLGEDKSTQALHEEAKRLHVVAPMSNMDKLPAWTVAPYALTDAALTYKLYHHLLPKLEAEDLLRVHELERESAMVAVDMRKLGVRVDLERAHEVKKNFHAWRDAALKLILDVTGMALDPFNTDHAIKALRLEDPNVNFGTTDTGKESVRKEILESLHTPVARAILQARRYDKAAGTFIDGYIFNFERNGRIHPEFHPTRRTDDNDSDNGGSGGTTSGRFASSNPNAQNIPNRDEEIGPAVRSCFVPEDGEQWCKKDWKSQEPRLTVHFAYLAKQRGAEAMVERFRNDSDTDLHGECAILMNVDRQRAKIINLALAYGAQGANICHQLGLPTTWITSKRTGMQIEIAGAEGQALLDKHFEAVPFIKGVFDLAKNRANERGFVTTISGRRIRFEKYADGNYVRPYKALNGVIQGSAADQMKMALVAFRRERLPVNLTVHDEADCSLPMGELGGRINERMSEIMQDICPISVPMIAETTLGANWGEC